MGKVSGKMDRHKRIGDRHLDFQKSFNSVNHRLLARDVKAFGANAEMNNWTAQIQKGRAFRVRVAGRPSDIGLL